MIKEIAYIVMFTLASVVITTVVMSSFMESISLMSPLLMSQYFYGFFLFFAVAWFSVVCRDFCNLELPCIPTYSISIHR